MGLNVLVPSPILDITSAYYPDVQDNRYYIGYPITTDVIATSAPMHCSSSYTRPVLDAYPEAKTGTIVHGFARDWYDRIHVTPSDVNVGNLLTLQVHDVYVWNAFTTPKVLSDIHETADSGVTLVQPEALPVTFSPFEVLNYQLAIDVNGPPAVTGSFVFDFGFTTLLLTASGNRVVVWPFMPQHGVVESLEWKTDIIRAKAGEQRIALRDAPRQAFSYKHFMNDHQVSMARAMAVGWAQRQFGIPVWPEATYLGQAVSGTTTLNLDTTVSDYRVGDSLLLWQDYENFEAIGIDSLTSSSITLKLPVTNTLEGAYASPLRYARASGITLHRDANQLIKVDADFNVLQNKDIGASIGLPTFAGLDVLTDVMNVVSGYDERIEKVVTMVDNGFGITAADGTYTTTDQFFNVSWSLTNRADLWRVRTWLHSLKGRQKTFWLPTNASDLELTADAASVAQSIIVRSINYALYYTTRTIRIKRKNGVVTFHSLTGGTTSAGEDTLSMTSAIGIGTLITDIEQISFMYKVRLDADRIEINHDEAGFVTIKVPVTEVVK